MVTTNSPCPLYTNLVHTLDSLSMGFEAEFETSLYGVSIPRPQLVSRQPVKETKQLRECACN